LCHLLTRHISPYCPVLLFSTDTATTEIYTLSLHDALPILVQADAGLPGAVEVVVARIARLGCGLDERFRERIEAAAQAGYPRNRSEEHTSELQSRENLVCRLLLEKKNNQWYRDTYGYKQ